MLRWYFKEPVRNGFVTLLIGLIKVSLNPLAVLKYVKASSDMPLVGVALLHDL